MFIGSNGTAQCCFFQSKEVSDSTASGIKVTSFATFCIDLVEKLVIICVDGTAINLGV